MPKAARTTPKRSMSASLEQFAHEFSPKIPDSEHNLKNAREYWFEQLNQFFEVDKKDSDTQILNGKISNAGDKSVLVESAIGFFMNHERQLLEKHKKAELWFVRDFLSTPQTMWELMRIFLDMQRSERIKIRSALAGVSAMNKIEELETANPKQNLTPEYIQKMSNKTTVTDIPRSQIEQALSQKDTATLKKDTAPADKADTANQPIRTDEIRNIFSLKVTDERLLKPEFQEALTKIIKMAEELAGADKKDMRVVKQVIRSRPSRDWRVLLSFTQTHLHDQKFFEQFSAFLVQNKNFGDKARFGLAWIQETANWQKVAEWMEISVEGAPMHTSSAEADPYGLRSFAKKSDKVAAQARGLLEKAQSATEYEPILEQFNNILQHYRDQLVVEKLGRSPAEMEIFQNYANKTLRDMRVVISSFGCIFREHTNTKNKQKLASATQKLSELRIMTEQIAENVLKKAA